MISVQLLLAILQDPFIRSLPLCLPWHQALDLKFTAFILLFTSTKQKVWAGQVTLPSVRTAIIKVRTGGAEWKSDFLPTGIS